MAVHVINEVNRCLNCKKPMCMQACPIHTPIPMMIKAFKKENLNEAGEMLFENNPMSMICSLVCNHENQCEGHCVLDRKGEPVHISSIENYVSDTYFDKMQIPCQPKNGKKVAVIGAGPAGITIAILLAKKGYGVTIFDSRDKIGGVLQYGIPAFSLPKSILERYKLKLREIGIKIRPNTIIGGALEIKDLFRDGYQSIFIGTGVWRPKTLGIKGEFLGNVHFAIDYLANPDSYDLGDHVAIIGMGNSAMDVARTALRKGSRHVTLYARGLTSQASDHERLPTQSWMARSWLSAGSRWRSMMTARYLRRFFLMRMAIRPEWIRLRCRFRQIGRSFPSARVRRASWSTLPMV